MNGTASSHAAICVNEGLLRILDEQELYGVLAHAAPAASPARP
jgi:Zn-dependent protease with chaperone function